MRIKSWIHELPAYEPGRPIEETARELGFAPDALLVKLASNENALGPSPRAVRAMKAVARQMHRYPDGSGFRLRRALSERLRLPADQVMLGHGSNEILALLGHVFLDESAEIVMAEQAFLVYRLVANLYRARTRTVPMRDFTHDLPAMLDAVTPRTRLLFVANPNNPTGTIVSREAIERFMDRVPDGVAVVFDEAYVELLDPALQPDTLRYVRDGRPVFVLRTFSKTYGLAGLRVGYAAGPAEGIRALERVRQPFNVNAMAQEAALAALDDEAYVIRTRRLVARGLRQLTRGLAGLGVETVPSVANFLLARTGNGRVFFEALQRKRVIVRPMDVYGLSDYIRVTVGAAAENRFFLAALRDVLQERKTP